MTLWTVAALVLLGAPCLALGGVRAGAARSVAAIEIRAVLPQKDRLVEATARYFRNGCFVRETWTPMADLGPAQVVDAGCTGPEGVKKLFQDADRRASKVGLVPAGHGDPPRSQPGPREDWSPEVVVVLSDGTRWRGRDLEAATELTTLLEALARDKHEGIEDWAAPATARAVAHRGLHVGADGRALSPRSRSVQVIAASTSRDAGCAAAWSRRRWARSDDRGRSRDRLHP